MRTNTTNSSPKIRMRVASATVITLATLTLSGGVAGALNFRSPDSVGATSVPATVDHPTAGTSIRIRQVRVRQVRVRQVGSARSARPRSAPTSPADG
jgi:hypothetical protein